MTKKKFHKGEPRTYRCPVIAGADITGPVTSHMRCGATMAHNDGDGIALCSTHGVPMKMVRKTQTELFTKGLQDSFFIVGEKVPTRSLGIFSDVSKRKSMCRACKNEIAVGSERLGFTWRSNTTILTNGGYIATQVEYVHKLCFVDLMMDGKAGEGCPGCSAKVIDKEFRDLKKEIKEKISAKNGIR